MNRPNHRLIRLFTPVYPTPPQARVLDTWSSAVARAHLAAHAALLSGVPRRQGRLSLPDLDRHAFTDLVARISPEMQGVLHMVE